MQSLKTSTRVRTVIATAGVAMLVLAGCGSDEDATTAESGTGSDASPSAEESATEEAAETSSFPLTFENADGTTTEIPAQPTTIASTSVSVTGALLSFDAPVVASGAAGNGQFFAQWVDVAEEKGVETLWPAGEVDLEALVAAAPDLIVVSTSGADSALDNVADFQEIAPTIVVDYGSQTWQDLTLQLAEATGMTEQAEATIAEFDTYVEDAKGKITVPEGEANIISFNGPGENNPVGKVGGPHAELLASLGFTIEDPNPEWHNQEGERADFVWASYENLTELTADTTFILSQDNEGAKAFADDPVMANLPSVVNGQVYGLGVNSFRIDYFSSKEIVDSVVENFGSN